MTSALNPAKPSTEPCMVLIADDDTPTRMLLQAAVGRWGYKTIEARDGEEAWAILIGPKPPRLIILDWLMPKLDGIALCERIKQDLYYHPYTILLTQLAGTTNIMTALDAGADEFLSKPFNMAELQSRLAIGKRIIGYEDALAEQNLQLQKFSQQPNALDTKNPADNEAITNAKLLAYLEKEVAKKGGKISVANEQEDLRITIALPSEPASDKKE